MPLSAARTPDRTKEDSCLIPTAALFSKERRKAAPFNEREKTGQAGLFCSVFRIQSVAYESDHLIGLDFHHMSDLIVQQPFRIL